MEVCRPGGILSGVTQIQRIPVGKRYADPVSGSPLVFWTVKAGFTDCGVTEFGVEDDLIRIAGGRYSVKQMLKNWCRQGLIVRVEAMKYKKM